MSDEEVNEVVNLDEVPSLGDADKQITHGEMRESDEDESNNATPGKIQEEQNHSSDHSNSESVGALDIESQHNVKKALQQNCYVKLHKLQFPQREIEVSLNTNQCHNEILY